MEAGEMNFKNSLCKFSRKMLSVLNRKLTKSVHCIYFDVYMCDTHKCTNVYSVYV